jgi:UDP-N-acetylmuramoyl-L-alanyl-D-glutamate--2,6-diaminopimelate ligase
MKNLIKALKRNSILRKGIALLGNLYYGFPSRKLIVFGITGTNGKTTTSYFLKSILEKAGYKVGLIGTSGYWINEKTKIEPPAVGFKPVTTPNPFYLQWLLKKMVKEGTKYVVMEVSSFGLRDFRVFGINFKGAILTNVSNCHHLLEHGSFKNYLESKKLLFKLLKRNSFAILNKDDKYFEEFKKITKAKVISYGLNASADVLGEIIKEDFKNLVFKVKKENLEFEVSLYKNSSRYNVLNALSAIALALNLNIDYHKIKEGIESCPPLSGRFEIIKENDFKIIVDKANTPQAFREVILRVKNLKPKRIIGVYGNFFEFPLNIRQELAEISTSNFDLTIITSDDSGKKDPQEGIDDFLNYVVSRVEPQKYLAIKDRREAIKEAINRARKGDVILILGRGDEKLMNINGKIIPFDDREVVKEILQEFLK